VDNDLRVLRGRHEDLEDELDRRDMTPPDAGKALLVQVVSGGSSAGTFFTIVSVEAAGDEKEGSTPTFTPEDNTFTALNLGTQAPANGTYLVARYVGGKWVVRYDG